MFQKRRLSLRVAALAVFAAGLSLPNTASAQLGRLKKAAADAAKEAAGVKPENKDAGAENFPITAERLDAVIATLEPAMIAAQKEMARKAVADNYEKSSKAWMACVESAMKAATANGIVAPTAEHIQQAAALAQSSGAQMQRYSAASQAKRYREAVATQDTMTINSLLYNATMFGVGAKCGKATYMPPEIIDAQAAKMAQSATQPTDGRTGTAVAPAQRAGMTLTQFGMVRERAALWALQQTGNAPVGNNKYSVFTTAEQSVLESRGDRLKKMAPFLKDQPARWTSWGDLQSW